MHKTVNTLFNLLFNVNLLLKLISLNLITFLIQFQNRASVKRAVKVMMLMMTAF